MDLYIPANKKKLDLWPNVFLLVQDCGDPEAQIQHNALFSGKDISAIELAREQGIYEKVKNIFDQSTISNPISGNAEFIQTSLKNKSKWEIELAKAETIQNEIDQIQSQMEELKSDPGFRTPDQMEILKADLKGVEEMMIAFKRLDNESKSDQHQCPVCIEHPETVFSCKKCFNWICGSCKDRIDNCPQCKEDLSKRPLRRNRALERHLKQ